MSVGSKDPTRLAEAQNCMDGLSKGSSFFRPGRRCFAGVTTTDYTANSERGLRVRLKGLELLYDQHVAPLVRFSV